MKKKLLTVLLAVVMVFGVFSLAACGDKVNPDSEYNYYGTKYSLDGDVKIEAATFQGVYKMFTTAGKFLLYVDSEGEGAASRFQAINKLAQNWDVTIYHFNPDLTGGYDTTVSANIIKELPASVNAGGIATVQNTLSAISKVDATEIADHSLLAISGAESSASASGQLVYNGKISKAVSYDKGAEAIAAIATRKPSYAQYAENGNVIVPAAYNTSSINTMNLFGDNRLHMYNEDGTDALTDEKTDVYVTVATYAQFAHLMDNNEGYFAVFFGGTWCPNTQAIAKATNDLAKDYGIAKIYFFDPRLDDGTKVDAVSSSKDDAGKTTYSVVENSAYLASSLNSRNNDADAQWASLKTKNAQYVSAAKAVLAGLTVKNGDFAPNAKYTSAQIDKIANDAIVAKSETLNAKYLAAVKADYTESAWNAMLEGDKEDPNTADEQALIVAKLVIAEYNADKANAKTQIDVDAVAYEALANQISKENIKDVATLAAAKKLVEANAEAAYKNSVYNYADAYAKFLDEYLSTYKSEWNYKVEYTINGKQYTKMCVPNMMMFNGEGEGKAALVGLAEAEYTWGNVSVDGTAENVEWNAAIEEIFKANPYHVYNPIPDAPEADDSAAAGGSTGGSAAAAPSAPAADSGC